MSVEGWLQKKVSDLCDLGRGRVISAQEIELKPGIYPVFSSQSQKEVRWEELTLTILTENISLGQQMGRMQAQFFIELADLIAQMSVERCMQRVLNYQWSFLPTKFQL